MKTLKRWTTGIFSRVDWAVSQIENQEALINSALKESREAVARAKVQMGRVRQDGNRLQQALQAEESNVMRWRSRAGQVAGTDENRALECLRRSKLAEAQRDRLVSRVQEHRQIEQQLDRDVAALENRFKELLEKRNLLRVRQSRAEALTGIQEFSSESGSEVDEIFERWEVRVTEKELATESAVMVDFLEESFAAEESDAELRSELSELLAEQKISHSGGDYNGKP